MITGYWVTQIVHGAAVAGYAERLHQGPATAAELAASAGLNVPAVGRHLRACASLGLVTFDGRAFSATPLLDILRLDHPQSLRGFALAQPAPGHWLPWGRFVDALSTGEHQTVATLGSGLFDYYARTPAEADAFTEAMEGLTGAVASEAARVLDMTGVRRVVDIGGGSGSGALLAPLLEANPTLSGALYDYPHIIDGEAFSNIPSLISKRIGKVGGDFLQQVPPADLYLLKWILHARDDDQCVLILQNCRKAIAKGGRVAILEFVLENIGEAGFAPLMDLNMLVLMTGRERTLAEYQALLSKAGFGDVAIMRTESAVSVITARQID